MAKLQMSLRIDADLVRRAQKALGARTKTEVVERSLATIVEIEKASAPDPSVQRHRDGP